MSSQGNARRLRKGTDYISKLPDTVLCHILSFLPTKIVMKTSILSKRWKYLWTKVPALDFTEKAISFVRFSLEEKICFKSFVDRVLFHNNVNFVQRFCLNLHDVDEFNVKSWLTAAARREIREIDIALYWTSELRISLPSRLLSCDKLVVLKLRGQLNLNLWVISSLPNLETIHLEYLKFPDHNFFGRLLCCCPTLKKLHIVQCDDLPEFVNVVSSTLKLLTIVHEIDEFDETAFVSFVITTPKVSYLNLQGTLSQFDVRDMSSVIDAHLHVVYTGDYADVGQAQKFLSNFSGAKSLHLTTEIFVDRIELPIFENLTYLKQEAGADLCKLLKCAPKLKTLVINYANRTMPFDPEIAPKYLPSLENIVLHCLHVKEEEFSMFAYFLKAALALKKMNIDVVGVNSSERRIAAYDKLLSFPRSSAVCQVYVGMN